MQPQRKHVVMCFVIILSVLSCLLPNFTLAGEKQWVVFQNDLSPEIKRINIPLNFTSSESLFYESTNRQVKSEAIPGSGKKDDYKQQFDFGVAVDGYQYLMQVRDTQDYKVISSNPEQLCGVKILRMDQKGKATLVKEGNVILQRSIEIPLEVPAQRLGIPSGEPLAGSAIIEIYRNDPSAYQGRFDVRLRGSLSGSSAMENASIDVSIMCRNSTDIKDRQLSLSVKPFDDRLASLATVGKLSDILMLGSAKLAVEKIASDGSEMVLALLNGQIIQEKNPETMLETGKLFPEFTRIELVNRRLLTLSDLKKQAGAEGYIVLIFGDLKKPLSGGPGFFDPRLQGKTLGLDDGMVVKTIKNECEKPVVICFVCRQLSLSDLYEKWLGRELEFCVLSEYSNPMEMRFLVPGMEHYGMNQRPDTGETLRGQLGLPADTVITALINGRGELVYINTNAVKELSGALVQINKMMKENKIAVEK
jgi:hypothetical protein